MPLKAIKDRVFEFVVAQALHLGAMALSLPAFLIHLGWLVLAVATWGGQGSGPGAAAASDGLLDFLQWLGVFDDSGQGDEGALLMAWTKLSLLFHVLRETKRWLFGAAQPLGVWRAALLSWAVATVGYAVAALPVATPRQLLIVVVAFPTAAALATLWASAVLAVSSAIDEQMSRKRRPDVASAIAASPGVAGASNASSLPVASEPGARAEAERDPGS